MRDLQELRAIDRRRQVSGGLALALLGIVPACSRGEAPPVAEVSRAAHGVASAGAFAPHWSSPPAERGNEACADCHGELVRSYARTGMARALGPVRPEELAGLGGLTEEPSGWRYELAAEDGRPVLVETRPDAPGHRLAFELAFAIGAGELDRAFAAVHGELLWFAPLEVVTAEQGRHVALAPPHAVSPDLRLRSAITPECLGCHTDSPPPPAYPLNLRPDPERWEPHGISCAACHGSVAEHVAWQEADLSGSPRGGADPVLRPAALTRVQRLSICAACHLQGDVRIGLVPGRLGPPPPGGDLLDELAIFVAAQPDQDVGFVAQVERLVLSPCFLASEMSCETCHDPHRSLFEEDERARVRAGCLACHPDQTGRHGASSAPACARSEAPAGPVAEPDCASCHMRRTPVFDVAEVEVTDHWIRVDPGPPSEPGALRADESAGGEWGRFVWPRTAPPEHVADPGLWMMAWGHSGHLDRALPLLEAEPGPAAAGLPMYHHVRGSLLDRNGRAAEAEQAYWRALELDPDLTPSATNLGLLLGRTGRAREGVALLSAQLERHPAAEGALRNRAVLLDALGDAEGARADLARAHELWPRAELARALAEQAAARGDPAAERRWRARARELDPRPR